MWTKGKASALELWVDRNDGNGFMFLTIHTEPNTPDPAPGPGNSVMWKYKAIYLRQTGNPLAVLGEAERRRVEEFATECADLFQRSSSAVQGRNGQLSLHHHARHRLSGRKLNALTVIHDYLIRRAGLRLPGGFLAVSTMACFRGCLEGSDHPPDPRKSGRDHPSQRIYRRWRNKMFVGRWAER